VRAIRSVSRDTRTAFDERSLQMTAHRIRIEGDPMGQLNSEPIAIPDRVAGCQLASRRPDGVEASNTLTPRA